MSDVGIIYYADGVKNLYRSPVDLTAPIVGGLSAFQILSKRLSNIHVSGSVLLVPDFSATDFAPLAKSAGTELIRFSLAETIEKPYSLNQQHWAIEDGSGNDSWLGSAFAAVFQQKDWETAILIPLTNMLIDPSDVGESLELHYREGFEVTLVAERIPGAEWAIFDRDLILGLNRSNPEVMTARGALYWAIQKPLYPFKVGTYHSPRIRPRLSVNLRLNSQRALNCFKQVAHDDFATSAFSYGRFLSDSGWEKAYAAYAPLQINVEPSSLCGASCNNCPNALIKRQKGLLSANAFVRAISDIEDKDARIVFSGIGEPLLNPELNFMLEQTSGFCTTLQTSLQKMPDSSFPYKSVDHIRISMDSDTKRGFESLRSGCSCENITGFIDQMAEMKTDYCAVRPEIGLDYLRRGCSEADIMPFMKKWRAVCRPVFKNDFFRWPYDSKPDKISWYQISGEASYCGKIKNTSSVDFEPVKRRPCRNAILSLTVLSDGTVTGCPFDAEGDCCALGNITENTLLEIWKSEKAEAWRQSHLSLSFSETGYCSVCKDWFRY